MVKDDEQIDCGFPKKSDWPKGEWMNECDFHEFEYKGYICVADRKDHGAWCGYAVLPKEHPLVGKELWNNEVLQVHGGITQSDDHYTVLSGGQPKDAKIVRCVWSVGFDCCHAWDIMPGFPNELNRMLSGHGATYKNLDFVINELKKLVDQLNQPEIEKKD